MIQTRQPQPPSPTANGQIPAAPQHTPRRTLKIWWWTGLAALSLYGVYAWMTGRKTPAETQVRIATVRVQTVRKTVSASGIIQPWTTVDIKSKAGGRIDQLLVDVGDRVRPNQVIARIDPSDSKLTFRQAQADTASAGAKEDQAETQYRLQQEQTRLLVQQAQIQLISADANVQAAQARLATAKQESDNQPVLLEASISQAASAVDAAKMQRAQLDSEQAQETVAASASLNQATSNATVAKLNFLTARAPCFNRGSSQRKKSTTLEPRSTPRRRRKIPPAQRSRVFPRSSRPLAGQRTRKFGRPRPSFGTPARSRFRP